MKKLNKKSKRIPKIVPSLRSASTLDFSYLLVDYLGREVGRILCKPQEQSRCLLIDSFCVAKKWRGKAQGLRLMEQVKNDALQSGQFDLLCAHSHGEEVYDSGLQPMRTEDIIRKYESYGFTARKNESTQLTWMVFKLR